MGICKKLILEQAHRKILVLDYKIFFYNFIIFIITFDKYFHLFSIYHTKIDDKHHFLVEILIGLLDLELEKT